MQIIFFINDHSRFDLINFRIIVVVFVFLIFCRYTTRVSWVNLLRFSRRENFHKLMYYIGDFLTLAWGLGLGV